MEGDDWATNLDFVGVSDVVVESSDRLIEYPVDGLLWEHMWVVCEVDYCWGGVLVFRL